MKPQRFFNLLVVLTGFLAAAALSASEAANLPATKKADPRIEVVFQNPEKFTDVKDSSIGTDRGRDELLEELRSHIITRAEAVLPKDLHLKLVFTDIDLAGEYEPWRVNASEVRIVKDIYPPCFEFSYTLTDSKGAVVKQGQEVLRDIMFMHRMVIDRSDHLRYEKQILGDWLDALPKTAAK